MDHGLIQVRHAVHVPVNKQSKRNDTDITEAARGDYMPQWSFLYTSFLCNCLFIEESYIYISLHLFAFRPWPVVLRTCYEPTQFVSAQLYTFDMLKWCAA